MTKMGFANGYLRSFIERIERLEEEKAALAADIREVYSEAKGQGFDTKIMRQVIKLRKLDTADRQEQEATIDLYMHALGMLGDTPLGRAAIHSEFGDVPYDPETGEIIEPNAPRPSKRDVSTHGKPCQTTVADGKSSLSHQDSLQGTADDSDCPDGLEHEDGGRQHHEGHPEREGEVSASLTHHDKLPDIPPFLDRRERRGAGALSP